METIETLIPDNEGNHLVVVLYFYDDYDKINSFQIPPEFSQVDKVFYREKHAPIIHLVTGHLSQKYS